MENLLYLVHRIPYPPNKGDKIRSYHLLKYLSEHYHVYLGTFVDAAEDWQYAEKVRELCVDACLLKLDPRIAKLRCFSGFFSGKPLTLPYYYDKDLEKWIETVFETYSITKIVTFSAAMTQYVRNRNDVMRVIDFVDIDSDKWMQYAQSKSWPLSWLYRRESSLLFQYEKKIAQEFDKTTFVSINEATLFKKMTPEVSDKVDYFNNGVDVDYFSPEHHMVNPYPVDSRVLVFTGAMDYWANVDAVEWFAQTVFPMIREHHSDIHFFIVGSNPAARVLELVKIPGITVTGSVEDIRPYLKFATIAIAPLRIARGIQNKVLEAMAMGKKVVVSPQAMEGIHAIEGKELYVVNNENEFLNKISELLADNDNATISVARQRILSDYSWEANLAQFGHLLRSTS